MVVDIAAKNANLKEVFVSFIMEVEMAFLNALALFIGWFFLVAFTIYFILSLTVSVYAFIFWYREWDTPFSVKMQAAFSTGFRSLWWWVRGLSLCIVDVLFIRYLRSWGCSYQELAERWGVSEEVIKDLEKGSYTDWWYPLSNIRE